MHFKSLITLIVLSIAINYCSADHYNWMSKLLDRIKLSKCSSNQQQKMVGNFHTCIQDEYNDRKKRGSDYKDTRGWSDWILGNGNNGHGNNNNDDQGRWSWEDRIPKWPISLCK